MMNRLFKRGMVIALAAAMTTSAGIPAMAAQKETLDETLDETVTTSEVTQNGRDRRHRAGRPQDLRRRFVR